MSKINSTKAKITTRALVTMALLSAISVVLARLIIPMPNVTTRFSIEAVPIILAGHLFGPLSGAIVGFVADFVGCLFSGYGYNPIFCVPPILYGVTAGLFQGYLVKKRTLPRLALSFLPAIVLGSILYQSASLTLIYAAPDARAAFFLLKLATRGIQFSITWVIDVLLVHLLFQCKLFDRAGLWPPKRAKAAAKAEKGTEAL